MNPESTTPDDDAGPRGMTPLEVLLARALEQQENGETVDLAKLCEARPDLRGQIEAALARRDELQRAHLGTAEDPALGVELAERYRLDERIGAGAMGVVYSAADLRLDRQVAVKVLRPDLVVGARMDQRLAREAKALARIRHPNVVTVHDSGQCRDGRSFVVMEKLRGCSIGQLLGRADETGRALTMHARLAQFGRVLGESAVARTSDVRLVVDWVRQAAEGVQAAHEVGVVHRDIKPSNLFLETAGKVVVLDFGIVSVDCVATVGGDGSPIGTPAYMAPEQVVAGSGATPQSDVYGLAATLYHLLTGRPPFGGTIQQVLHAVTRQDPVRADQVRPGLPADLVAVVEKGMAKEPARRYASAQAFRDDLVAWLEHRPVTARRASWLGATSRRLVRSPAARTVAVMVLFGAIAFGMRQWMQARDADRRAIYAEALTHVPPSLVNDLPSYRATNALRRDPDLARLLDQLVELADEPAIALALRAMHRVDCEQFEDAAADARRIAAVENAPFALAASARFEARKLADDLAEGAAAPQTGGPGDRCFAVLHAMRSAGPCPSWAEELLATDDGLSRHALFAELDLLSRQRRAAAEADLDAQIRAYEAIERAAIELATRRGQMSGILYHLLTNALIYQTRIQEAHAMAQRGCDLVPGDFALWLLNGWTALRRGDAAAAVARLRKAIELQPRSRHAGVLLSDALLAAERFDEARRAIDETPFSDDVAGRAEAAHQRGLVALADYYARRRQLMPGDEAGAAAMHEMLLSAAAFFAAARSHPSQPNSLAEALCASLIDPSFSRRELIEWLAGSPLDGESILEVAGLLPTALDADETKAIVQLLRAQAKALGVHSR